MRCPLCRSDEQVELDLRFGRFNEDLVECRVCGTVWSVNRGVTALVKDPYSGSFLEALTGDNTCFAAV